MGFFPDDGSGCEEVEFQKITSHLYVSDFEFNQI